MSETRPILIVTAKLDTHADAVISELKARGQPFFRLNTDDFHTEYRTMLRSDDRSVTFEDIWGRSVRFPHDVHAIWHRKPVESNNPPGVEQRGTADMIQSETLELLNSLSCFHDRPWYNNPESNRVSQRKFPQLCLASELGFRVPRTLITNDPGEARRFAAQTQGGVLCKAMKEAGYSTPNGSYFIFSRRVGKDEFDAHADRIALCPTLLQEYIEKAYELRVTVVGDVAFACRLDSQADEAARIDWRMVSPDRIAHSMVTLDNKVEAALKAMMRRFGLRFGAFDLIVTPEGETVFLELNPNGQWYWIELTTGAPMASAMADLLQS